jgi:hypothetical protein
MRNRLSRAGFVCRSASITRQRLHFSYVEGEVAASRDVATDEQMIAKFHVEPVGHTLGIVGSDGRVYGGVPRGMRDTVRKTERMLRIVEQAYMAGFQSMRSGTDGDFEIRAGRTPDGRGKTWQVVDGEGRIFAAVSKGLWPTPPTHVRKLKEIVEHAFGRARDHVLERSRDDRELSDFELDALRLGRPR